MQRRMAGLSLFLAMVLAGTGAACAEDSPREGKYRIQSYGRTGAPPLYLGYVVLEKGTYKVYLPGDKPAGEGKYLYDAGKKAVIWQGGPYEADKFGGEFTVDREGKTHKIRLKSTTIAVNNTDAP